MGKTLALVLSVVVIGVSLAFCFRKDTSPLAFWTSSDDPFGTHVERRVGSSLPLDRFPAPAPAAIAQPGDPAAQAPTYHQSFRPVGTLLPPVAVREEPVAAPLPPAAPVELSRFRYGGGGGGGVIHHTVEDGDTLTKLAQRYLGGADAYFQIFEANRDVLASPDLLPIGAVLTIPNRGDASAGGDALPMVPVPARPGS